VREAVLEGARLEAVCTISSRQNFPQVTLPLSQKLSTVPDFKHHIVYLVNMFIDSTNGQKLELLWALGVSSVRWGNNVF
jgi:hypothetical protein